MNLFCQLLDGGEGVRFNVVTEASGKANRPEHTQLIFCKALLRLADGADDAGLQVSLATYEIKHFSRVVAHDQTIDREVAAGNIFLRFAGINNLVGMTAIGITDVLPKGSHFDFAAVARHEENAELRANRNAIREKSHDPGGRGVGRDIIISRLAPEQQITHTAAHKKGLLAMLL